MTTRFTQTTIKPFPLPSFFYTSTSRCWGYESTFSILSSIPKPCYELHSGYYSSTQLGRPFLALWLMLQKKKNMLFSDPSNWGMGDTHHQNLLFCSTSILCQLKGANDVNANTIVPRKWFSAWGCSPLILSFKRKYKGQWQEKGTQWPQQPTLKMTTLTGKGIWTLHQLQAQLSTCIYYCTEYSQHPLNYTLLLLFYT